MSFVWTDHTKQHGYGKESAERLAFTWDVVAESQELPKTWDYKQALDTSLLPKAGS
jgi:hypothetical protein